MKILIMLTRGGAQARRAEKNFFGGRAPPLSQGLDGHPQPIPPPPSDSDSAQWQWQWLSATCIINWKIIFLLIGALKVSAVYYYLKVVFLWFNRILGLQEVCLLDSMSLTHQTIPRFVSAASQMSCWLALNKTNVFYHMKLYNITMFAQGCALSSRVTWAPCFW